VPPNALSILLNDVGTLLKPRRVTVIPDSATTYESDMQVQANRLAVLALSDIWALFGDGKRRVQHKILFYVSQLLAFPLREIETVSIEVVSASSTVNDDVHTDHKSSRLDLQDKSRAPVNEQLLQPHLDMQPRKVLIEELNSSK
jgi:hypothetical protein